ncbi:YciI family protein [Nocardioides pacificus]
MKYVLLIHSNPQPWGHPTGDYVAELQALPAEERQRLDDAFEAEMTRMQENGELIGGEALGDSAAARLYRWGDSGPMATDGPYSETKEHLAGFFLIDVGSQARAEEIAAAFSGPGETVELRPTMWPGGHEG